MERTTVNIGKSVVIKGELSGSEDLTIEGQVEGKIELRQNVLTIGANGKIKAQVFAKAVIIFGEVTGNVTATEKVDIRDNGSVDGDITSPRVATRAPKSSPLRASGLPITRALVAARPVPSERNSATRPRSAAELALATASSSPSASRSAASMSSPS